MTYLNQIDPVIDDQLITRYGYVNIFQVMGAGTADFYLIHLLNTLGNQQVVLSIT